MPQPSPFSSSYSEVVVINVGGQKFQTLKSTLMKHWNGYFGQILLGNEPHISDGPNCIFVDRSPKHFDYILTYLRYDHVAFPNNKYEFEEVKREFEFYRLRLPPNIPVQNVHCPCCRHSKEIGI